MPNPIVIRDIDHVVFRVVDLETVAAFWRDVLGAAFEKHQEAIGLYQLRVGTSWSISSRSTESSGAWAALHRVRRGATSTMSASGLGIGTRR